MPCHAMHANNYELDSWPGQARPAPKRQRCGSSSSKTSKIISHNRAAIVPRKQEVRVGNLHKHIHSLTHTYTDGQIPVFLLAVAKLNFVLIWP